MLVHMVAWVNVYLLFPGPLPLIDPLHKCADIWITILLPSMSHMQYLLSGIWSTRLRIWRVLLFKFRCNSCKESETLETEYEEFHSDNLALTTKIHAVSGIVSSRTLLGAVSSWPQQAWPLLSKQLHKTFTVWTKKITDEQWYSHNLKRSDEKG